MVSRWYHPRPQFLMVRPYLGLFCHRAAIPTPASGPWLGHHISHWKNTGIFYFLSVCNSQPFHQDLDTVTVSAFHICVCSLLSVSLCFVLPACSLFRPQIHIGRMARLASDVDLRNHAVSHNPCVLCMVVRCRSRRPLSTGLCTSQREGGDTDSLISCGPACIVDHELSRRSMSPVKAETHKDWKGRRLALGWRNVLRNTNTHRAQLLNTKHQLVVRVVFSVSAQADLKKAQCSERNVKECECNVSFLFNSSQVIHAQVLGEFCEYVRSPVTARPSKSATSTPWLRVSTVLLRAQGLCNAHISYKLFLARVHSLQNFSFRTFAMCLSIFWFCLDWQWRAFWQ